MNIAQPLSELLKNNNVSRSKLAREIGVHTSSVSNWLDGKDVKPDNLSALCDYFQCSLDFFAQNEKTPAPKGAEVNLGYLELNAENRAFIDYMIEKLIKSQSEN